jgi:tripartite-type tricarboxylate transporter receptor subunit TctC
MRSRMSFGAPVTIELKPGHNGIPAAREVAESKPDGATLFMATLGTHAIAPYLAQHPAYDPLQDFTCLSLVSRSPMLLACHPALGVNSVAYADRTRALLPNSPMRRRRSAARRTSQAELFQRLADVTMRHVRYDQTGCCIWISKRAAST